MIKSKLSLTLVLLLLMICVSDIVAKSLQDQGKAPMVVDVCFSSGVSSGASARL
jgi:hypothetical protein